MGIPLAFLLGWSPCFLNPMSLLSWLTPYFCRSTFQLPEKGCMGSKFCFLGTEYGILCLKLFILRILSVLFLRCFLASTIAIAKSDVLQHLILWMNLVFFFFFFFSPRACGIYFLSPAYWNLLIMCFGVGLLYPLFRTLSNPFQSGHSCSSKFWEICFEWFYWWFPYLCYLYPLFKEFQLS